MKDAGHGSLCSQTRIAHDNKLFTRRRISFGETEDIEVIFFLVVLSMRIINIRFVLLMHVCVSYDIISTRFSTVPFIGRFCIFRSNDALIPSAGPQTVVAPCIYKTCSQIHQLGGHGLGSLKNKFWNSTPISKKALCLNYIQQVMLFW
jgi:hypothetical protein